ncbi:MAG: RNA polymerase sigma-70 factor [Bacteroidales bacterium]|nr:RNA polymerase sigma-70 factor [Bacteroidales bacterium]
MKPERTDKDLVENLQKGDLEAFCIIYKKYSGKLYSFGLKHLQSQADAEGLVQSVFMKLWETHKNLKKELSFNSFLFTIAYNEICNRYRERRVRQKYISQTLYLSSMPSTAVEDKINNKSLIEYVEQIINKLPDRQKVIFVKSKLEDRSNKEIAKELGLAPATIENYLSKSLKFIRNCIHSESLRIILPVTVILIPLLY